MATTSEISTLSPDSKILELAGKNSTSDGKPLKDSDIIVIEIPVLNVYGNSRCATTNWAFIVTKLSTVEEITKLAQRTFSTTVKFSMNPRLGYSLSYPSFEFPDLKLQESDQHKK